MHLTEQPEALRLADALNKDYFDDVRVLMAADELRRLHEENEALRADAERLDWCISILYCHNWLTTDTGCGCCGVSKQFDEGTTGRAAIDAARSKE